MGFDNECILNIHSLAGEYFCPVCRTLVYPNEAFQSQCTHLYCKTCLTYIAGTSRVCPYDGYLVTVADSKPLIESNKTLAETISKIVVCCLYHMSGCTWQGPLSECTSHCSGCAFGNSAVVCNICGIQIVHRQAQEHAKSCPGANPQAQQVQPQPQPHLLPQPQLQSQSQPQMLPHGQPQPHPYVQSPLAAERHNQAQVYQQQQVNPAVQPISQIQSQAHLPPHGNIPPPLQPHPLQPHQQHVNVLQYQQPHSQMQPLQLQNQPQPHSQAHLQPRPHPQPASQPHLQVHPQAQPQNHPQLNPTQPIQPPILNAQPQSQQPSAHAVTSHDPYLQLQAHQQMQPGVPRQHPMHIHFFVGSLPQAQMHDQFPEQPPQICPPQSHSLMPNQHPASFTSQGQVPSNPPAQHQQINLHTQQTGHQVHQRSVMYQSLQPAPQQYVQQPFPAQTSGLVQSQFHQHGHLVQHSVQSELHPHAPPHSMLENSVPHLQPQPSVALAQGMHTHHSQNYAGRPSLPNHGQQSQPLPQSCGAFGVAAQVRPIQLGSYQPSGHQNYAKRTNIQLQASSVQQFVQSGLSAKPKVVDTKGDLLSERGVPEQEAGSPHQKTAEKDAKGPGADSLHVKGLKSETGMKFMDDEHKPVSEGGGNSRQHEILDKEADSDVHVAKDGSTEPGTKQTVKQEGNDCTLDYLPSGKSVEIDAVQGKDATNMASKQVEHLKANKAKLPKDAMDWSMQASLIGGDCLQCGYQVTPQGPVLVESGGLQGKGFMHYSHPGPHNDQRRHQLLPMPYEPSTHQQRHAVSSMSQSGPPSNVQVPGYHANLLRPQGPGHLLQQGQPIVPTEHFQPPVLKQPGSFHPDIPHDGVPVPGSTVSFGSEPGDFGNISRSFAPEGQHNQGHVPLSHTAHSRTSQGEPVGWPPRGGIMGRALPHGPEGQIGLESTINPVETEMFPNQKPRPVDGRHPNSHVPGSLDRGPFGQFSDIELSTPRINRTAGLDSSSTLGLRVERFKTLTEERPNPSPMGPTQHLDQGEFQEGLKQFPRPSNLGTEASPKFESYFSLSRPNDRGPGNLRMGEHARSGELIGLDILPSHLQRGMEELAVPGSFPHPLPLGESDGGNKSSHPRLSESGFRGSYSRQGFRNDGGIYPDDNDSFDKIRKRKPTSTGWCRICKVDCETVEGLELHSQSREHQKVAMDVVISIKKWNAKKHKTFNNHSLVDEARKSRFAGFEARGIKP